VEPLLLFTASNRFFTTKIKKVCPDLERDPFHRWLNHYFLLLQILLGLMFYIIGGWSFLICGIFISIFLL
jgi:fatty-acid desaturase